MVAATHRPSEALSALLRVLRKPRRREGCHGTYCGACLGTADVWSSAAPLPIQETEERHREAAVDLFLIGGFEPNEPNVDRTNPQQIAS